MKLQRKGAYAWISGGFALLFWLGALCLVYPSLSCWWNETRATSYIDDYESAVLEYDGQEYAALKQQAQAFNQALLETGALSLSPDLQEEYEQCLNLTSGGIMGWVSIPALDIQLPIYHGTSQEVLQSGAGHLEGSSLPVGGIATHAVISAHSGLTSASLFDGLDLLQSRDLIQIHVLGEVLVYQVSSVEVVLPEEIESLKIDPEQDQITLVTCTPYGVNTHRLLVHALRTDAYASLEVRSEALQISSDLVSLCFAFPMVLLLLACVTLRSRHFGSRRPGC